VKATKISFEQICNVWKVELWPDRVSAIEPQSAMTWPFEGTPEQYDMNIFEYNPVFWGVYIDNKLVGVNSGHRTTDTQYRSRGIWVNPQYRKHGVSQMLFNMTEHQAKIEGCNMIWSIPRKSALPAYTKFGFETVGDYFDEGMEFGPNIYVSKDLNESI
jgi:GNAT superfamily N-acetyltransferase